MTATATQTMKFIVNNKVFQQSIKPAIEVATKGVTKGINTDHLISLEAKQGDLLAKAFGGKLAIDLTVSCFNSSDLNYKCEDEGLVTINAIDLLSSLSAFPPDEDLAISCNGKEVTIAKEIDKDEFQSLPLTTVDVILPEISTKTEKEVVIDRLTLLKGYERVAWALGFEDHMEQYFYWQMLVAKKSVRFVAGTGGRFSVYDVKGDTIVSKCDNKTEFLIHRDQSYPIALILKSVERPNVGSDDVTIRYSNRDGNAPEQIVFEVEGFKLIVVGFDSGISYPNVDKFLNANKDYKIRTKVSDWEYPTKGLLATWSEEAKKQFDSHESEFEPFLTDNHIIMTTSTGMRAKRKVAIEDVVVKGPQASGLKFYCNTEYLAEIYQKNRKEDVLEIEYFDDKFKPLIIKSQESDNGNGVTDQLTILLAPLKKGN